MSGDDIDYETNRVISMEYTLTRGASTVEECKVTVGGGDLDECFNQVENCLQLMDRRNEDNKSNRSERQYG